ncbi:hypothetical protein Cst_c16360 [Thermoclostridium stercorarium subsp. stercorarium DSM 8532]|uniref:Uncharacterized protein n=1 Tax=Thermoclostridium stercorarium (strain ATCC 35414 / DSM 8532 / NCIMB 11754) TaxID=1121335 RepID=L7VKH6_THES1|nr:hypothetical protein Cst_c16360 [Thermoclostridium stercorarium subsp. stercorarium DSM 8532]
MSQLQVKIKTTVYLLAVILKMIKIALLIGQRMIVDNMPGDVL